MGRVVNVRMLFIKAYVIASIVLSLVISLAYSYSPYELIATFYGKVRIILLDDGFKPILVDKLMANNVHNKLPMLGFCEYNNGTSKVRLHILCHPWLKTLCNVSRLPEVRMVRYNITCKMVDTRYRVCGSEVEYYVCTRYPFCRFFVLSAGQVVVKYRVINETSIEVVVVLKDFTNSTKYYNDDERRDLKFGSILRRIIELKEVKIRFLVDLRRHRAYLIDNSRLKVVGLLPLLPVISLTDYIHAIKQNMMRILNELLTNRWVIHDLLEKVQRARDESEANRMITDFVTSIINRVFGTYKFYLGQPITVQGPYYDSESKALTYFITCTLAAKPAPVTCLYLEGPLEIVFQNVLNMSYINDIWPLPRKVACPLLKRGVKLSKALEAIGVELEKRLARILPVFLYNVNVWKGLNYRCGYIVLLVGQDVRFKRFTLLLPIPSRYRDVFAGASYMLVSVFDPSEPGSLVVEMDEGVKSLFKTLGSLKGFVCVENARSVLFQELVRVLREGARGEFNYSKLVDAFKTASSMLDMCALGHIEEPEVRIPIQTVAGATAKRAPTVIIVTSSKSIANATSAPYSATSGTTAWSAASTLLRILAVVVVVAVVLLSLLLLRRRRS